MDGKNVEGMMMTTFIMIEQYLRYGEIVKETKIGMLPKIDHIEDEDEYLIGIERKNITEKDKNDMIQKFSNYLLKK